MVAVDINDEKVFVAERFGVDMALRSDDTVGLEVFNTWNEKVL